MPFGLFFQKQGSLRGKEDLHPFLVQTEPCVGPAVHSVQADARTPRETWTMWEEAEPGYEAGRRRRHVHPTLFGEPQLLS